MSKKICICVGHGKSATGAYDPGAVSKDGKYEEHKIAREIAKYSAEYLQCDLINYDGSLCLTKRIKEVNKGKYDFAADIHLNAGGGTGTETFYFHGSPTGKKAADEICKEISRVFDIKNRGAKIKLNSSGKDYFGFIRQTEPCAILVETVFIDNKKDLEKIKTDDGMKKCGEAIGRALERIFADNKTYKVIYSNLNIRAGAGTNHEITGTLKYGEIVKTTITSSDKKWAKLADGRGWMNTSRSYVKEVAQ